MIDKRYWDMQALQSHIKDNTPNPKAEIPKNSTNSSPSFPFYPGESCTWKAAIKEQIYLKTLRQPLPKESVTHSNKKLILIKIYTPIIFDSALQVPNPHINLPGTNPSAKHWQLCKEIPQKLLPQRVWEELKSVCSTPNAFAEGTWSLSPLTAGGLRGRIQVWLHFPSSWGLPNKGKAHWRVFGNGIWMRLCRVIGLQAAQLPLFSSSSLAQL